MSLADALEAAAGALPEQAERIRPANGDAARLLTALPSDAAQRVAGWLIANRPADAEELAAIWCEEPAGQSALLGLEEGSLPKQGRKLLRRVRHRLRSRGVKTPEPTPAPTVARLAAVEEELGGAFASGFDPGGARQVWWLEPNPAGGTRLFECLIDDARGVLSFDVYQPTRSELRRFLRSLTRDGSLQIHPLEPALAKALLLSAAEQQASDRPAPKRWVEWRGRLGPVDPQRLPGQLAREALGADQPREALDAALALLNEGRIGPWPPQRALLTGLVERFRTALDGPLVVSSATRRDQVARLVEEAADECFAGAGGRVAMHRFRESAFGFWRAGDEAAARACLAAADAFEHTAGAQNPLARAFVELWLRPLLQPEGEPSASAAAEPSLLVRP